jgi:integrase
MSAPNSVSPDPRMKRVRHKLTKRLIDSLPAPPDGVRSYIVSDTEDDGLRLRVFKSGAKVFALEYRTRGGRVRWYSFGQHPDLSIAEARRRASTLRVQIREGFDPVDAAAVTRTAPTFSECAARWVERSKVHKKPSSRRNDELLLRLYLLPRFGKRKIRDLSRQDVQRLQDELSGKKTTANRCQALLSTILNYAEAIEEREPNSNPCRLVKHYKERRVERALTLDELAHLWEVLDSSTEQPSAVAAIRFLALSGLRCGEVLALRWDDVDITGKRVQLRDSKTGPRKVLINEPAVALLDSLPRASASVFAGRGGTAIADLTHPWQRVREQAGLPDVRLHDLRHSFASLGIAAGLSLPEVGKLLGHRSVATTHRYAHLLETAERAASDRLGMVLSRVLNSATPLLVVQ